MRTIELSLEILNRSKELLEGQDLKTIPPDFCDTLTEAIIRILVQNGVLNTELANAVTQTILEHVNLINGFSMPYVIEHDLIVQTIKR